MVCMCMCVCVTSVDNSVDTGSIQFPIVGTGHGTDCLNSLRMLLWMLLQRSSTVAREI